MHVRINVNTDVSNVYILCVYYIPMYIRINFLCMYIYKCKNICVFARMYVSIYVSVCVGM